MPCSRYTCKRHLVDDHTDVRVDKRTDEHVDRSAGSAFHDTTGLLVDPYAPELPNFWILLWATALFFLPA